MGVYYHAGYLHASDRRHPPPEPRGQIIVGPVGEGEVAKRPPLPRLVDGAVERMPVWGVKPVV